MKTSPYITLPQCTSCSQAFEIDEVDMAFYDEVSPKFDGQKFLIPPPEQCPQCRQRRRLAWRNERALYRRPCGVSGKPIISIFSEDKPHTVYDNDAWYESNWDARDYGQEIDFNRPFFEQFDELLHRAPLLARATLNLQNSDYTNECGWSKNCYLIFEADSNENCMYCNNLFDCRWSQDCLHTVDSELCFECIDCHKCYNTKYSQDCNNCTDSFFLKNCIGCQNCIGCVNMRNKQYHIFNEPHSKEEYEKKRAELMNGSWQQMEAVKQQFEQFRLKFPHKCFYGVQNEDSRGDHLRNTQRCHDCFDVYNGQDCRYVYNSYNVKKVHDMMVFGAPKGVEFCYENHEIGDGCRNILFSDQVWTSCSNLMYCKLVLQNSHDCFGCVSLKHASYCILNKQYEPDEYQKMMVKLAEHMKKTGEWGKPLPMTVSPFSYNESVAQQYYPLTAEQAQQEGLKWKDKIIEIQEIDKVIPADKLPDKIADIPEDMLNWAVRCPNTGRPFRIIDQEYKYYKEHNVPLPRYHPDERHRLRHIRRNPPRLVERTCQKCNVNIWSSFTPDRPEIVFCEKCYQNAVQ